MSDGGQPFGTKGLGGGGDREPPCGDIESFSLSAGERFSAMPGGWVGQRTGFLKSLGAGKLKKCVIK